MEWESRVHRETAVELGTGVDWEAKSRAEARELHCWLEFDHVEGTVPCIDPGKGDEADKAPAHSRSPPVPTTMHTSE